MSDLIDREFIKRLGGECIARRDRETGELIAITGIDLLPAAQPDAQPQLVRCKDCKLWPWRPLKFMDRAVEFTCCEFTRGPEGFCAWGKRRADYERKDMDNDIQA